MQPVRRYPGQVFEHIAGRALERNRRPAIGAENLGYTEKAEVLRPDPAAHSFGGKIADEQLPGVDPDHFVPQSVREAFRPVYRRRFPVSAFPVRSLEGVLPIVLCLQQGVFDTDSLPGSPDRFLDLLDPVGKFGPRLRLLQGGSLGSDAALFKKRHPFFQGSAALLGGYIELLVFKAQPFSLTLVEIVIFQQLDGAVTE